MSVRAWWLWGLSVIALVVVAVGCEDVVEPTPEATPTAEQTAAATTPPSVELKEPSPVPATIPRTPRPSPTPTPTPAPKYKLALISAKCTLESDIGFTECEGFVENISGKTVENVEVVIIWVDDDGVPQSSDEALIDYNPILAGQQSPWSTIGTYNPALTRFRVQFKELLGGTILTRDDRPD
jgi:hypothetical protein